MIRTATERLGARALNRVARVGKVALFCLRILRATLRRPFRFRRLVREVYDSGVLSLAIVCASGVAVGMVLGLQLYSVLLRFGAEESLGAVVGLTLIRELGPVLTGLLVTGRAGSAMAAEIGMMAATEQIDGIQTMAIDPVHYVIVPKALAMSIAMPLLSCLFILFALFGSYLVAVGLQGLDHGIFMSGLEDAVIFRTDVVGSLWKALLFGLIIAGTACYRGFHSARSTAGVSASTTSTVVTASVVILLADYVFTALWDF